MDMEYCELYPKKRVLFEGQKHGVKVNSKTTRKAVCADLLLSFQTAKIPFNIEEEYEKRNLSQQDKADILHFLIRGRQDLSRDEMEDLADYLGVFEQDIHELKHVKKDELYSLMRGKLIAELAHTVKGYDRNVEEDIESIQADCNTTKWTIRKIRAFAAELNLDPLSTTAKTKNQLCEDFMKKLGKSSRQKKSVPEVEYPSREKLFGPTYMQPLMLNEPMRQTVKQLVLPETLPEIAPQKKELIEELLPALPLPARPTPARVLSKALPVSPLTLIPGVSQAVQALANVLPSPVPSKEVIGPSSGPKIEVTEVIEEELLPPQPVKITFLPESSILLNQYNRTLENIKHAAQIQALPPTSQTIVTLQRQLSTSLSTPIPQLLYEKTKSSIKQEAKEVQNNVIQQVEQLQEKKDEAPTQAAKDVIENKIEEVIEQNKQTQEAVSQVLVALEETKEVVEAAQEAQGVNSQKGGGYHGANSKHEVLFTEEVDNMKNPYEAESGSDTEGSGGESEGEEEPSGSESEGEEEPENIIIPQESNVQAVEVAEAVQEATDKLKEATSAAEQVDISTIPTSQVIPSTLYQNTFRPGSWAESDSDKEENATDEEALMEQLLEQEEELMKLEDSVGAPGTGETEAQRTFNDFLITLYPKRKYKNFHANPIRPNEMPKNLSDDAARVFSHWNSLDFKTRKMVFKNVLQSRGLKIKGDMIVTAVIVQHQLDEKHTQIEEKKNRHSRQSRERERPRSSSRHGKNEKTSHKYDAELKRIEKNQQELEENTEVLAQEVKHDIKEVKRSSKRIRREERRQQERQVVEQAPASVSEVVVGAENSDDINALVSQVQEEEQELEASFAPTGRTLVLPELEERLERLSLASPESLVSPESLASPESLVSPESLPPPGELHPPPYSASGRPPQVDARIQRQLEGKKRYLQNLIDDQRTIRNQLNNLPKNPQAAGKRRGLETRLNQGKNNISKVEGEIKRLNQQLGGRVITGGRVVVGGALQPRAPITPSLTPAQKAAQKEASKRRDLELIANRDKVIQRVLDLDQDINDTTTGKIVLETKRSQIQGEINSRNEIIKGITEHSSRFGTIRGNIAKDIQGLPLRERGPRAQLIPLNVLSATDEAQLSESTKRVKDLTSSLTSLNSEIGTVAATLFKFSEARKKAMADRELLQKALEYQEGELREVPGKVTKIHKEGSDAVDSLEQLEPRFHTMFDRRVIQKQNDIRETSKTAYRSMRLIQVINSAVKLEVQKRTTQKAVIEESSITVRGMFQKMINISSEALSALLQKNSEVSRDVVEKVAALTMRLDDTLKKRLKKLDEIKAKQLQIDTSDSASMKRFYVSQFNELSTSQDPTKQSLLSITEEGRRLVTEINELTGRAEISEMQPDEEWVKREAQRIVQASAVFRRGVPVVQISLEDATRQATQQKFQAELTPKISSLEELIKVRDEYAKENIEPKRDKEFKSEYKLASLQTEIEMLKAAVDSPNEDKNSFVREKIGSIKKLLEYVMNLPLWNLKELEARAILRKEEEQRVKTQASVATFKRRVGAVYNFLQMVLVDHLEF